MIKNKRIVWLGLSCLMTAVLMLASCTADTTSPTAGQTVTGQVTQPSTPTTTTPTTPTTTTPTEPAAPSGPQYGGTLNLVITSDPASLSPREGTAQGSQLKSFWMEKAGMADWTVDRDVFNFQTVNTPLRYMTGQLLESWDEPDNTTIIFHVREGVRWQNKPPVNGRELTAEDIEFTFHWQGGLGSGYTEPNPIDVVFPTLPIESVTATDKYTVTIKLSTPSLQVLPNLLMDNGHSTWIVPPELLEQEVDLKDWRNAVGTGPFTLDDYVGGSSLTFGKNQNYWGYDELNPENKLPYVDTVQVLIIPDVQTRIAGLRAGKVDKLMLGLYNPGLEIDQAESVARTSPELIQVYSQAPTGYGVTMRVDNEPFTDINVRRALQMAIDLPTIASTYYKGSVDPRPAGITWPGFTDHVTPFDDWPEEVKKYYTYNPDGAKQLLAEAGYPDGFDAEMVLASTGDTDTDLAQIVKAYWSEIGVDVELNVMDVGAYWGVAMSKGHESMAWFYTGLVVDPPTNHTIWYQSESYMNFSSANDSYYDGLVAEANASTDRAEQARLCREAEDYQISQLWSVALLTPRNFEFYQPWLKGYNGEAMMGMYQTGAVFARVWIDQDLKDLSK